jgi:uncharacterized protein
LLMSTIKIVPIIALCSSLFSIGCAADAGHGTKALAYRGADEIFTGDCLKLARAAAAGRSDQVQKIVSAGTTADCRGYQGVTPLYWAVAAKNTSAVGIRALVSAGASPTLPQTDNGLTAVHYAAKRQDTLALDALLEAGAPVDPRTTKTGETPLFNAGSLAVAKRLVDAGADMNVLAKALAAPGHRISIMENHAFASRFDVVAFLLDKGADPTIGGEAGGLVGAIRSMKNTVDRGYGASPGTPAHAGLMKIVDMLQERGFQI